MARGGLKSLAKSLSARAGFEIQRTDPSNAYPKRRQALIERKGVGEVLDVGAHAGEFGASLRHYGYTERIVSFEPVAAMFERLCRFSKSDPRWDCRRLAVGDRVGEATIHISGNDGFSSSIREMEERHVQADPASAYVDAETVELTTLDAADGERIAPFFLKVDTQGFESEVLAGATETLEDCAMVELELGLVSLYSGQALFDEMVALMSEHGFVLADLEPGFCDKRTDQLLQVDGLFVAIA